MTNHDWYLLKRLYIFQFERNEMEHNDLVVKQLIKYFENIRNLNDLKSIKLNSPSQITHKVFY